MPKRRALLRLVAALLVALARGAAAQGVAPPPSGLPDNPLVPPLVVALSQTEIEITTAFTGSSLMVFGATEQPLGPGGDEVIVVARGPTTPLVVRRKVRVAGLVWVNGPAARFAEVPGYYALAGTREAYRLLPEEERLRNGIGLDALTLTSTGSRSPQFRAALLQLEKERGSWLEDFAQVDIDGARLFHVRLPLPATVVTGDYRVEVLLVRSRRIIARQEVAFRIERTGTADRIATVAQNQPLFYGAMCVLLAALAGWLGSVLFRRN